MKGLEDRLEGVLEDRLRYLKQQNELLLGQNLVEFYRGGSGMNGRTLQAIWDTPWQEWETLLDGTDCINWLFPTDTKSAYTPNAPILSPTIARTFAEDNTIKRNLQKSFDCYINFLGFQYKHPNMKRIDDERESAAKAENWLYFDSGPNPNWLRCSRILQFLRLVGEEERCQEFYNVLEDVYRRGLIPRRFHRTVSFWQKSAGLFGQSDDPKSMHQVEPPAHVRLMKAGAGIDMSTTGSFKSADLHMSTEMICIETVVPKHLIFGYERIALVTEPDTWYGSKDPTSEFFHPTPTKEARRLSTVFESTKKAMEDKLGAEWPPILTNESRREFLAGLRNGTKRAWRPGQGPDSLVTDGICWTDASNFVVVSAPGRNKEDFSTILRVCAQRGAGSTLTWVQWKNAADAWWVVWKTNTDRAHWAEKTLVVLTLDDEDESSRKRVGFAQSCEIGYLKEAGYPFVAMSTGTFVNYVGSPTLAAAATQQWGKLQDNLCLLKEIKPPRGTSFVAPGCTDVDGRTALHWAMHVADLVMIADMLRLGWDINMAGDFGGTPLMWAAYVGNFELVNLLLENRADPTKTDSKGDNAAEKAKLAAPGEERDKLQKRLAAAAAAWR